MARRLSDRRGAGRRHAALLLLMLAVASLHGLAIEAIGGQLGEPASAMPARIEVAYVRELTPTAPPLLAARPAVATPAVARRAVALQPMPAASAPQAKAKAGSEMEAGRKAKVEVKTGTRVKAKAEAQARARAQAKLQADRHANAQAQHRDAAQLEQTEDRVAAADPPGSRPRTLMAEQEESPADVPSANDSTTEAEAAGAIPDPAGARPASASASAVPAFVWPASTRISYILTGNYRGPVQGDAQVEWVHVGSRYQVHLDVTVGASFAPLITRRMTSDGELTAEGLAPQRYDQETKLIFHDRHRASLRFEAEAVVLADGRRRARVAGVQDSASQFIQLSYLFTTQPGLLQVGRSVELPLALPRKLDRWTYDVAGEELLWTSFGPLTTFHVKPRHLPQPGGDLVAEAWFAPELRYLPVRIRISQDAETYIDLLIARKPELAAS